MPRGVYILILLAHVAPLPMLYCKELLLISTNTSPDCILS